MALATQCPHCHTTFRVAHDQLKLRAGLVRCGACKQIFNGIENLLRPEELERTTSPQPSAHQSRPALAATTLKPQVETTPDETSGLTDETIFNSRDHASDRTLEDINQPATIKPGDDAEDQEESTSIEKPTKDDPLLRMTLMDFTHERRGQVDGNREEHVAEKQDAHDPLEETIDELTSKPWRREPDASVQAETDALDQADADDYEEPAFVRQGRRKQRIGRILRIFMATASVVLLISLLAQSAYVFRNQIAAWFPQTEPLLADACAYLGCQVGLPAQIDNVSIESSELQSLTANSGTFSLTVLLRNHSATDQAWPHIELTLNDAEEKAIARRVFVPREYLPTALNVKQGFGARSEQPVKLFFELSQLKASGYRVYLFYP